MIASLIASLVITPQHNTLTDAEKAAGWFLLFDGMTTAGWHNYKSDTIGDGWRVVDGVLQIIDPGNAGDIVTQKQFKWFELKVDFKLEAGQNSGILFHVDESGKAVWESGPEIQIYDAGDAVGAEETGYLYQLYKPKVDATRPVGEWNTFYIRVAPDICWTKLNGVTYYTYQFGSEDFWKRVAASKFAEFPGFAKAEQGAIAIQGDHGVVSFRNIKVRRIKG